MTSYNNGTQNVLLDTDFCNYNFESVFSTYKGLAESKTWTFSAMNFKREKASVAVMIELQACLQFGEIVTQELIKPRSQNNTTYVEFLSLSSPIL